MRQILRYKRIWLLALTPVGLLLTLLARLDNGWVETVHSRYVYPLFANSLGGLLSLVPFSVLEVLILLGGAALLGYLIWQTVRAVKDAEGRKDRLTRLALNLLGGGSVLYFGFVLFMGLNYYRDPIATHLDLQVEHATKQELYDLCKDLVEDCNRYRAQLQEGKDGVALLQDEGYYQTAQAAKEAMASLEEQIPILQAADIRNKPLMTSRLFSYALTTGIYIPFESGINVDARAHSVPATMCHELTHFRGFMREEEANFISYLACMRSDRADFRYSASLLAFTYAFSDLVVEDVEMARAIAGLCGEGMLRDLQAEDDYWNQFRGTAFGDASQTIYDEYLQANGQQSGLASYGEMVELLIAYRNR